MIICKPDCWQVNNENEPPICLRHNVCLTKFKEFFISPVHCDKLVELKFGSGK